MEGLPGENMRPIPINEPKVTTLAAEEKYS